MFQIYMKLLNHKVGDLRLRTYFEHLYENLFVRIANDYTDLKVISGYASSSFLSRVVSDFPHLKIELFIGMTSQGVSKKNHVEYQSLVKKRKNISVFYQIDGIPNHMKILEFSKGESINKKIFIGSANFSENGFFNNKEVMSEINYLPKELFNDQLKISLLCIDENINNYVDIYENEEKEQDLYNSNRDKDLIYIEKETSEPIKVTDLLRKRSSNENRKMMMHSWDSLKSKTDPQYYNSFEITVVLPKENNVRWASKGINAWVNNRVPVLEQTPKLLFAKVFPQDEEFKIYSDDGQILNAKLTGNFNGQLEVLNLNLYDYVRKRIGLLEQRPISYDDLVEEGYTTMYFTRINRNEYKMGFNQNY